MEYQQTFLYLTIIDLSKFFALSSLSTSLTQTTMNLPESYSNDLKTFFNQKEFVALTIDQIKKDLQGLYYDDYYVDLDHSANLLQDSIHALSPILTILSKRQPEQLSQFIYKVDLAEKKFFDSISSDQTLTHLAHLILEREAQKVYLRKRFS